MRYQRQLILEGWGPDAQRKLSASRILVVGAGGLGCPALQYLAAAGAGFLGIVDDDRVSLTDLHRQILYTGADEGALKTERAAAALQRLNPDIRVQTYPVRLDNHNALDIIRDYDLVLDASDNFGTRYLVGDACFLLAKPLVYGSVSRFEGQVGVFNYRGAATAPRPISYRDLFPEPPAPGEVLSCAEAGVLGVLTGIIGSMQALEAMKVLTGVGAPLAGRLLTYQSLYNRFYEAEITAVEGWTGPADEDAFKSWPYGDGCDVHEGDNRDIHDSGDIVGSWADAKAGAPGPTFQSIDLPAFDALRNTPGVLIADVRETGEEPLINQFGHLHLPLSRLREKDPGYTGQTIVVFCQTGKRSREAARILGAHNTVYQLEHGILEWLAAQSR